MTVEQLEDWKRRSDVWIVLERAFELVASDGEHLGFEAEQIRNPISIRTFLQRYGTEAHRDVFGESFWIDIARARAFTLESSGKIPVFTDVRFDNEADAITIWGGKVVRVVGIDEDTGDHPSEQPVGDDLIAYTVSNVRRDDDFQHMRDNAEFIDEVLLGRGVRS